MVEKFLEAERLLDADPTAYTLFNPFQVRCLERTAISVPEGAKIVIVPAPNGVGKTFVLTAILGAIMFPTRNPLFAHELYQKWPYKKQLRFVSTTKNVEDSGPFQVAIRELWPSGRYVMKRGTGKGYWSEIVTDTGFTVDILNYNMHPQEHAGGTRGAVFMSEPAPKPIFSENLARLRAGGPLYLEMTPLTYAAYIKDEYIDKGGLYNEKGERVGRVEVIPGDIEDNCMTHTEGGQLPHIEIERTIASYPIEERELRRTGKFGHLAGLIYQKWGDHNELDAFPDYHQELWDKGKFNLWSLADPHDRKPFALGWMAVFPNEDAIVVAEYPDDSFPPFHEMTSFDHEPEDYRKVILATEAGMEKTASPRVMDPNFGNAPKLGGESIKKIFAGPCGDCKKAAVDKKDKSLEAKCPHRLYYEDAPDSIPEGHLIVRKAIGNVDEGVRPKLYALKSCKNFCYGMRHYGYKLNKRPDETGPSEAPMLVHKDFPDLVRYAFLRGVRYRGEEIKRLGVKLVQRGRFRNAT